MPEPNTLTGWHVSSRRPRPNAASACCYAGGQRLGPVATPSQDPLISKWKTSGAELQDHEGMWTSQDSPISEWKTSARRLAITASGSECPSPSHPFSLRSHTLAVIVTPSRRLIDGAGRGHTIGGAPYRIDAAIRLPQLNVTLIERLHRGTLSSEKYTSGLYRGSIF